MSSPVATWALCIAVLLYIILLSLCLCVISVHTAMISIVCHCVVVLVILGVVADIYPSTRRFLVAGVLLLTALRVVILLYLKSVLESLTVSGNILSIA